MNKFLLLGLCVGSLLALSSDELYQKAGEFESRGDYKNAMLYYKMAAKRELEITPNRDEGSKEKSSGEAKARDDENLAVTNVDFSQKPPKAEKDSYDSSVQIYQTPVYLQFAYDFNRKDDRKQGEVEFGFSFEKPLIYDLFGYGEKTSFAYTQRSFWQTSEVSAPFRESNYMPEIFVQTPVAWAKYLQFGLLHESNGRSGESSRSWNKIYAKTEFFGYDGLSVTPQIWYGFGYDKTNKDIDKYMGYGDLKISYEFSDNILSAKLRNNLRFNNNRGALELGWMFPISSGVYGYLSYFSGYGESLIDYNRHVDKIGLGFAIR